MLKSAQRMNEELKEKLKNVQCSVSGDKDCNVTGNLWLGSHEIKMSDPLVIT